MRQPPEKDLYSILGVNPSASPEEIRDAYLARTRVIHPDRFDQQRQPQDWKKANEMLAELNEAYSILRNKQSKDEYDHLRSGRHRAQSSPPPPKHEPPPTFDLDELTPGHVRYADLPKHIQERLRKRQGNKLEDQFQIKLTSVARNYLFILILLCWFGWLFADAYGVKWKDDTMLWYAGFTLAVGLLIGRNVVTITRWTKSILKPYFYVTPLYFIKTEFDIVSFHPIWTLKDVAVTHNYKFVFAQNGSYRNSDVVLKFDGHNESLCLSSKSEVETMFNRMKMYDTNLRTELQRGNHNYFQTNDDFFRVSRSKNVPTNVLLSKEAQILIYSLSVILGAIGLVAASAVNDNLVQTRWVRQPSPPATTQYTAPAYIPPPPQTVTRPSIPEQPLPYSGSIRNHTSAKGVAPFEIKAAQGSHYLVKLVDAYSWSPVMTVFVRSGTTINIDVPLGTYEVRYASGDNWYGYEYLFGPDTVYSKADKTFTFEVRGNQVSGFTITLYKVANGNFSTSTIKPTDF